MIRPHVKSLAVAGALALAACAGSTKFNATWRAPEAGPLDFAGKKGAAVVMSPDEANRKYAEAYLARELSARGADGVAAYSLVPNEVRGDKDGPGRSWSGPAWSAR